MSKNIALVTGASSGIGEALVRELISKGVIVIGLARSMEKLISIKEEVGSLFIPMQCDVSDGASVRQVCQVILEKELCPRTFFLNAGMAGEKIIEDPEAFSVKMHQRVMAVNYFGVLAFVEFFEKPCLENGGGHFIVTSSVNAIFASPAGSAYCASKAAISKAFESLSLMYSGTGLRFSSIYSGPVATAGFKGRAPFQWEPEKMARYMCEFSTLKRRRGYPSLFYFILSHLFRFLPEKTVINFIGR